MPGGFELIPAVVFGITGLCFLYLLLWTCAIKIRIRRPRRPRPARALSLLGLAFAAAGPAVAGERGSASPHRSQSLSPAPPWSEPDGFSPPHPSGRTGVHEQVPDPAPIRPIRASEPATYRVRPGDSLWSIAGEWLSADDAGRIARYWPRLYRANAKIVGPDPDLIHPGQTLAMPPEGSVASANR
jgi:resuscitation-promoting factor RpfA